MVPGRDPPRAAPTDALKGNAMSDTVTTTSEGTAAVYTVTGMTCGHCVKSVTEEVSALVGVRSVEVDLATGRVAVVSDEPLDLDAVKAAVDEAGYEVVA
jgi:copper chaperone